MPTIFVSHAHQDNAWCHLFVEALKNLGLDVWYDEKGLQGGADWLKTIERELETREIFLIVLTPAAWQSEWVQRELGLAFTTSRRIIPVLHQPTTVSGFIRGIQWVDVVGQSGAVAAQRVRDVVMPPSISMAHLQGSYHSPTSLADSSPLALKIMGVNTNRTITIPLETSGKLAITRAIAILFGLAAICLWFIPVLYLRNNDGSSFSVSMATIEGVPGGIGDGAILAGSRAIPLASSYGDESAVAVATPYLLLTAFYLW